MRTVLRTVLRIVPRKAYVLAILAGVLALPATDAAASTGDDATCRQGRCRFYDFGTQVIDGRLLAPEAVYVESRPTPQFERLMKLRKTFLPDMLRTSRALRLR